MRQLHTFSLYKAANKIFFLFALLFSHLLHSQVLDTVFIDNIFNKGWQYIYTNPDSATWLFEKAKKESERRKYLPGLVMYYNYNAALQIALGENQKASQQYEKAIAIAKNNDLTTDLGLTYI